MTSDPTTAFKQNASDITNVPSAIRTHAPAQSYEMKGPLGSDIRKYYANEKLSADYGQANKTRANNINRDTKKEPLVKSKDVENRTQNQLTNEFTKAKDRGR